MDAKKIVVNFFYARRVTLLAQR